MMNITENILSNFEKISAIPRGTKNEDGIRNWLKGWANSRSLITKTDPKGNLVILVPGSLGYETHAPIILQGHLDMVCEKTPDSLHDFKTDSIKIIRDGDWIKADKTTLGADNGIAIAIMMSLVDDVQSVHPDLELLFTVEEELGLAGADNLDAGMLTGKTLINLDSEVEGVFTIGCAGGGSVYMTLPLSWESQTPDEVTFELNVSGLLGGHSGGDINKFRANAIKLIGRILHLIQQNLPIKLSELKGGTARNAIPREAYAVFVCSSEQKEKCLEIFTSIELKLKAEYGKFEHELMVEMVEVPKIAFRVASNANSEKLILLIDSMPQGVFAMSRDVPGLVETSNNIGIMDLTQDGLLLVSNHRSSVFSRLEEIVNRVEACATLAGAKVERTKLFPPWSPSLDSPLLLRCLSTYRSVMGEEPEIEIAHGGVECGIISERCAGLDTISVGPTIENPHTPTERLFVPSLSRTWTFLTAILKSM